ncbi:11411_t:CDS:1, partial [Racocetra fulgida]
LLPLSVAEAGEAGEAAAEPVAEPVAAETAAAVGVEATVPVGVELPEGVSLGAAGVAGDCSPPGVVEGSTALEAVLSGL